MPAVSTIHHPLRNVDADPGSIGTIIQIRDRTDWPAMDTHAHRQFGQPFQFAADFQCTFDWLLGAIIKNQRHAVAGRDLDQSIGRLCFLERGGAANDLIKLINQRLLLIGQALGISDDVEKENVDDLQRYFPFDLRRHCELSIFVIGAVRRGLNRTSRR